MIREMPYAKSVKRLTGCSSMPKIYDDGGSEGSRDSGRGRDSGSGRGGDSDMHGIVGSV